MVGTIFGREDAHEPELMIPRNGIMMGGLAEEKFDRGVFTVFPSRRYGIQRGDEKVD